NLFEKDRKEARAWVRAYYYSVDSRASKSRLHIGIGTGGSFRCWSRWRSYALIRRERRPVAQRPACRGRRRLSELEQCRNDSGCSRVVCYGLVFRRRAWSSAV